MKILIIITTILFFGIGINAQDVEIAGKAKITVMDPATASAQQVAREPDGTLSLRSSGTGNYGTIVNPVTGKVWLDRNLGATQVATSSTDAASYGDLYQWGRNADGHQIRTSGTTTTLASNYFTTNGLFITISTNPFNWLSNVETHMWSGTAAENNPCPSGFRIPTAAEWEQERRTWLSNDAAGAFGSPLKLSLAGARLGSSGSLLDVGSLGLYWSSTVLGTRSRRLRFDSSLANILNLTRALGFSVRCLKD